MSIDLFCPGWPKNVRPLCLTAHIFKTTPIDWCRSCDFFRTIQKHFVLQTSISLVATIVQNKVLPPGE